jgi:hypothetical protein
MRRLQEDTRAIAGIRLTAARTPVDQIPQGVEALPHDLVRLETLDICDESDAAGVVFESRIVEALFRG